MMSQGTWFERATLLFVVLMLMGIGVVMIYSTSAIYALDKFHDNYHFLYRQLVWCVIGLIGFLVTLRVDYHRFAAWSRWMIPSVGLLLVCVLMPPFAHSAGGAKRWVQLGPLSFQVSELAKFTLLVYLADFLSRKPSPTLRSFWKGFVPPVLMLVVFLGLILL